MRKMISELTIAICCSLLFIIGCSGGGSSSNPITQESSGASDDGSTQNNAGDFDLTFGEDGYVYLSDSVWGLEINSDDFILIGRYDQLEKLTTIQCITSNGELWSDFGNNGVYEGEHAYFVSWLIDSQDRIIILNYIPDPDLDGFKITRLTKTGIPDSSFGTSGAVQYATNPKLFCPREVNIDNKGRILVAGEILPDKSTAPVEGKLAVYRFKSNGDLDTNFGNGGMVEFGYGWYDATICTYENSIYLATTQFISEEGEIKRPGKAHVAVFKVEEHGQPDNTFGDHGKVILGPGDVEGGSIIIKQDGKLLVTGANYEDMPWQIGLWALELDGSIDTTFGTDGKVKIKINGITSSYARKSAIDPTGKIVTFCEYNNFTEDTMGNYERNVALLRFNNDGSIDTSFGENGIVKNDSWSMPTGNNFGIDTKGRIIIAVKVCDEYEECKPAIIRLKP